MGYLRNLLWYLLSVYDIGGNIKKSKCNTSQNFQCCPPYILLIHTRIC